MFSLISGVSESIKAGVFGENINQVLKKEGELCKTGSRSGAPGAWVQLSKDALKDCSAFSETCAKVAFVGTLLTGLPLFFFGPLAAPCAFAALSFCILTQDVGRTIERFLQLEMGEASLSPLFKECETVAARLEFLLKPTTFLRHLPTSWVESAAVVLGFIPQTPSAAFRE